MAKDPQDPPFSFKWCVFFSSKFRLNLNRPLYAHWKWYQKWWNLRWLVPPQLRVLISKKKILKIVWATNNWTTPLDRARRVVLEKVSRRIRCQLHLLLFDNSCRKCEPRWYWPRPRSKKVKALFLRKKSSTKTGTRSKMERLRTHSTSKAFWTGAFWNAFQFLWNVFFFLKKGHLLFWNAFFFVFLTNIFHWVGRGLKNGWR